MSLDTFLSSTYIDVLIPILHPPEYTHAQAQTRRHRHTHKHKHTHTHTHQLPHALTFTEGCNSQVLSTAIYSNICVCVCMCFICSYICMYFRLFVCLFLAVSIINTITVITKLCLPFTKLHLLASHNKIH